MNISQSLACAAMGVALAGALIANVIFWHGIYQEQGLWGPRCNDAADPVACLIGRLK